MHIKVENLVKTYKGRRVVDGVSFDVFTGEVVGLLGPNGAGKTTSFYMIVGLIKPQSGRVLLEEEDITRLPMYQRARKGIGYLPQESSIFRKLTVRDNVMIVWENYPFSREEKEEKLKDLLEEFSIAHLVDQPAFTLSGGERRRLELARAIATNPSFLLLDEPFTGVDPIAVADIQEIISHLKERGIGILITDHSVRETLAITDRAYIIRDGTILISGTSEEVANNPVAKKFYLGEGFYMDTSTLK
ncbi:MAG: LPS export ABC transporter ATP-binding protein [Candidatus Eremiobacterota bacterium]